MAGQDAADDCEDMDAEAACGGCGEGVLKKGRAGGEEVDVVVEGG